MTTLDVSKPWKVLPYQDSDHRFGLAIDRGLRGGRLDIVELSEAELVELVTNLLNMAVTARKQQRRS